PGPLTNMVAGIDYCRKLDSGVLRKRLATLPAGVKHPGIERRADHRTALYQPFYLVVGKLPLIGDEGAAIVMAGQDVACKAIEGFVKALICQVRHIKNHADLFHGPEQRPAARKEA